MADDMVKCGLCNTEILLARKIHHASKCVKRPDNFRVCKYNARHVMRKQDQRKHEETCQDNPKVKLNIRELPRGTAIAGMPSAVAAADIIPMTRAACMAQNPSLPVSHLAATALRPSDAFNSYSTAPVARRRHNGGNGNVSGVRADFKFAPRPTHQFQFQTYNTALKTPSGIRQMRSYGMTAKSIPNSAAQVILDGVKRQRSHATDQRTKRHVLSIREEQPLASFTPRTQDSRWFSYDPMIAGNGNNTEFGRSFPGQDSSLPNDGLESGSSDKNVDYHSHPSSLESHSHPGSLAPRSHPGSLASHSHPGSLESRSQPGSQDSHAHPDSLDSHMSHHGSLDSGLLLDSRSHAPDLESINRSASLDSHPKSGNCTWHWGRSLQLRCGSLTSFPG